MHITWFDRWLMSKSWKFHQDLAAVVVAFSAAVLGDCLYRRLWWLVGVNTGVLALNIWNFRRVGRAWREHEAAMATFREMWSYYHDEDDDG